MTAHAYDREWAADATWARHTAFVLLRASPVDVIKEFRALIPHCKPYKVKSTTFTYVRDVQLPGGPSFRGIEEQYAFCERLSDGRRTGYVCCAFLARGNLLTRLHVADREAAHSADGSQELLRILAAAAAEALAAA